MKNLFSTFLVFAIACSLCATGCATTEPSPGGSSPTGGGDGDGDTSPGDGDTGPGDGDTSPGDGDTSPGDGDHGGGDGDSGNIDAEPGTCETLPAVTDFAAPGPFADTVMIENVGPNNNYTLFRPDASLGRDGFKHPIATWGNGIATQPYLYQETLKLIATHGFVIIACNDVQAEQACLSAGLDWLVQQNGAGDMQGKLDTSREVTIGYSWGGGAAIDTASRPNVKATVSLYGMPPRGETAFQAMHSPLILFTATGDSFVNAEGYVIPNYEASQVQTFYATLQNSDVGHLHPIDENPSFCSIARVVIPNAGGGNGQCGGMKEERAPLIAWLRYWACRDQNARKFFWGDSCELCSSPWIAQRKNWQ